MDSRAVVENDMDLDKAVEELFPEISDNSWLCNVDLDTNGLETNEEKKVEDSSACVGHERAQEKDTAITEPREESQCSNGHQEQNKESCSSKADDAMEDVVSSVISDTPENAPTKEETITEGPLTTDSVEELGEPVTFIPELDLEVLSKLRGWANILVQCDQCKIMVDCMKLSTHISKFHGSKLRCDKCGRTLKTEKGLSMHYSTCQGRKNKESNRGFCEYCGKEFASLLCHIRNMHNVKIETCKICGGTFKSRTSLKRHEEVHSQVKNCICTVCGLGFTQLNNLNAHMRQHTQEKPYKCEYCEKAFTHNVSLKTHLKKEHGLDMWAGPKSAATGRRKRERDPTNTAGSKAGKRKKKTKN